MKKSIQRIVIAGFVAGTLALSGNQIVSAESIEDLQDQIREREQEKSTINEERDAISSDKEETESEIKENLEEQDSLSSQIIELEAELAETENNIAEKEDEIETTNAEIEELTNRIEELKDEIIELEDKIEKRNELLKDRLRSIQVNGGKENYFEVIFDASSFAEFIGRTTAVNTIMDQDQRILKEQASDKALLQANKEELEESRVEVETKKAEIENQKESLVALKGQLDEQKEEHQSLLAQLEDEHSELEEVKLTLEQEQEILAAEESAQAQAIAMAENKIGELEQLAREEEARKRREAEEKRRQEAEKQRQAEQARQAERDRQAEQESQDNNKEVEQAPKTQVSPSTGNVNSGSSTFSHPVNASINSEFGMRQHPVKNINRMHNGVDYRVGTGTPVRAAADGVVSTARTMGGFGNVVMISHHINGQNYTTVYAHLSSFAVSQGQNVSQGQRIAASGNTGLSSGPHLHFEIHRGGYGNAINPRSLLP